MTLYKLYNSSDCLVFCGSRDEFDIIRANNLINDSDRLVIEEGGEDE